MPIDLKALAIECGLSEEDAARLAAASEESIDKYIRDFTKAASGFWPPKKGDAKTK